MDAELALIFALTFVIHLVSTVSLAVRIAGARTRRIAVSFSIFNILVLISRTANSFQAPLLAKRVEVNLLDPELSAAGEADFRWLLIAATAATAAGALLIPTLQRMLTHAVQSFDSHRSLFRLVLRAFRPRNLTRARDSIAVPSLANVTALDLRSAPWRVLVLNVLVMAVWTVGVLSALYAGYLQPELRSTASQLSSIINGVATIVMFVFIDPYLALITDEVARGATSEAEFRRTIVWLTGSRLAGTLVAQLLFVPSAWAIVQVAEWL